MVGSEERSLNELVLEAIKRWNDIQYERVTAARTRSAAFTVATFLVSAATLGPVTENLTGGLSVYLIAGLALMAAAALMTPTAVIKLARGVTAWQEANPEKIKEYASVDHYYESAAEHFDSEKVVVAVDDHVRWERLAWWGLMFAVSGALLAWMATLVF